MPGARSPALPLCPRAGAHRADQRRRETRRRNTVDRMARWRAAAHEVLARHCRKKHFIPRSGRSRKNAVEVERDYLELKQEVGLGHYEGRGWPGFHHHGTLCIAVYGFLISEREMIPPSGPHCAGKRKKPAIPDSYRPRGAADPAPTSRSQLDRHAASTLDRRDRKNAAKMSILRKQIQKEQAPCFLTQYN